MGEYQNRAVALMKAYLSEKAFADHQERRQAYLAAAIDLFYAAGGNRDELAQVAAKTRPAATVDVAMGGVLGEMAAIAHLNDLDMVQAAYNTLDQQTRSLRETLAAAPQTSVRRDRARF